LNIPPSFFVKINPLYILHDLRPFFNVFIAFPTKKDHISFKNIAFSHYSPFLQKKRLPFSGKPLCTNLII